MSADRRAFILAASAAALGASASSCSFFMRAVAAAMHQGPGPLPPTRKYPQTPPAAVAIADSAAGIEAAVRAAVDAAGGLGEIERGQRVVIKPNATGPTPGGRKRITTNPEVVRAVIRLVKERGAIVLVGDRPAVLEPQTFTSSGFLQVCKEEGARLAPWSQSDYVRFFPRQRYWTDGFRIPKILAEADHWINVPVLKNHQITTAEFTCCLKSFVGVCHPDDRFQPGANNLHQRNIGEKIAELNLCSRPLLNIVDATAVMISGGPDGTVARPVWADANLILASRDRVACDSLALAVLKLFGADHGLKLPYVTKSVWDQVQIYRAAELGLGQADPRQITFADLRAPRFDEIKSNWI